MNKSTTRWIGIIVLAVMGCAGGAEGVGSEVNSEEPFDTLGQAITGGIQTATDYAVEVTGCSGTIINSHTIMTAAHCFDFKASTKKTVKVHRTVSSSNSPGSFTYARECVANVANCKLTAKILIHPDASSDPDDVAHDIALVITKQAMAIDKTLTPLLDITKSQGTGGYQVLSMGPTAENDTSAGLLRSATVPVDKVTAGTLEGKIYTNDAVHICHGDSGAPVVFATATVDDDTRAVVGALSPKARSTTRPVRTYANRTWLKKKAKGGCTTVTSESDTKFLDCWH